MERDILKLVEDYISEHGEESIIDFLSEKLNTNGTILTIVANGGVHPLNPLHKRGEIFFASEGNLDFSSEKAATEELLMVLENVSRKLKSKNWQIVYLVPFGPSVLSMLIKSLVYKILYIETVDVIHLGDGKHADINIDTRGVAVENSGKDS